MHKKLTTLIVLGLSLAGCSVTPSGQQTELPKLHTLYDYALLDNSGKLVSLAEVADALASKQVIFLGEAHSHPGAHLFQMQMLQALHARHPQIALSMEQFETDTQAWLDRYTAGEIGEWTLTHYARAWPNYKGSYRPLVDYARDNNLPVIAANAPKDIVVCVGRQGPALLDKLPPNRRINVAKEMDFSQEGAYFEKFIGSMGGHGNQERPSQRMLNSYAGQVVRDETMAQSIVNYLTAHPQSMVVHTNGSFHSEDHLGTVERVTRRLNTSVAVIQPVLLDDPQHSDISEDMLKKGDYLLLIAPISDNVKLPEYQQAWMKSAFTPSNVDCNFSDAAGSE
ncbi:ChaN family lipoprotein [Bowmanella sp. JS7-9]|uniref:ChaN family lipoprotein n=2 Tax=Pseudobowmanella zhangzhouensis TaxID=1537679 RepID=A0ABW1XM24_9ALTE|nr:ChaN family lipoprotein [Bowmanella sp. JS7-9]TBX23143.1 hypothetical protein TK45_08015 [Bowmanella sp. JS7-9]